MGRARKYQVSVGLSSDLIDIIEKTIQDEGYVSRSQFLEDLIRENIFHRCVNCKIHKLLLENNIDIRHIEMPRTILLATGISASSGSFASSKYIILIIRK